MLNYLMTHPELQIAPPDVAELCAAFDLAVADLQEKGGAAAVWANKDDARAAMASVIVEGWRTGERDRRRLADRAVEALPAGDGI